jgi:hypothetical protein
MRTNLGFCLLATATLLAGCHGSPGNNATETADTTIVTRDTVIGRWSTQGAGCTSPLEYKADGTIGGLSDAHWTLVGDQFTAVISGNPPDTRTVTRTGPNSMRITEHGGQAWVDYTRCP